MSDENQEQPTKDEMIIYGQSLLKCIEKIEELKNSSDDFKIMFDNYMNTNLKAYGCEKRSDELQSSITEKIKAKLKKLEDMVT